jgi:hypothetical protein
MDPRRQIGGMCRACERDHRSKPNPGNCAQRISFLTESGHPDHLLSIARPQIDFANV